MEGQESIQLFVSKEFGQTDEENLSLKLQNFLPVLFLENNFYSVILL